MWQKLTIFFNSSFKRSDCLSRWSRLTSGFRSVEAYDLTWTPTKSSQNLTTTNLTLDDLSIIQHISIIHNNGYNI